MTYTPKRPRRAQQDNAIKAAASAPVSPCPEDAFAFEMDYGTGKSQTILDEWGMCADSGGPQDFLCLAPAGSYRNWFENKSDLQLAEIEHMDPEFRRRMRVAHWRSGAGVLHRQQLEHFMSRSGDDDRPRALFVNIEALSSTEKARALVKEFAEQRWCYCAIDESTVIKGRKSERTKFLLKLSEEFAMRRIATGQLTPNGPKDAWAQFAFLSKKILGCRSYQDFQGRYEILKRLKLPTHSVDVTVGYKNLDDLRDRIAPYKFRVLKSECLDLEEKQYVTWDSEHEEEQHKLYQRLKNDAMAQLPTGEHVSTQHVMTKVMRLHQINCGFSVDDDTGKIVHFKTNRYKDLVELLGTHRGKAVIWTPYLPTIKRIRAALEEAWGDRGGRLVAEFHGMNKTTRSEDERKFLGDPECLFMIATQSAGGRGNTWVVADLEVYFANSDNLEHRKNSEDRLHRMGQVNRVTVCDMITPGTVDEKIVKNLRRKATTAAYISGEEAREWFT